MPFSQDYMEEVLVAHAGSCACSSSSSSCSSIPRARKATRSQRRGAAAVARASGAVANVDEDRILTAFAGAIDATLRTNLLPGTPTEGGKPYISIKLDPRRELPEAPLPRPRFEIFVYSPRGRGRAPARR